MIGLRSLSNATCAVARRSAGSTCLIPMESTMTKNIVGESIRGTQNDNMMTNQQQCRWKHSNRQVKRLFKQHPARARVHPRNPPVPPPEPKYQPVVSDIKMLPNGWIPPPPAELEDDIQKLREKLPFSIQRTRNKPNGAIGFLPVYSDSRVGGTKQTTIIKKVTGDRDAFIKELISVLKLQDKLHKTVDDMIRLRASGTVIEVDGSHTREVKKWLASLGF